MESKFADLSKANLELQKTERELRNQIVSSIPKEEVEKLSKEVQVGLILFGAVDGWGSFKVRTQHYSCKITLTIICMIQELQQSDNNLKIECAKLKEVADVARNQVEMFESRGETQNVEMEALRHQVIDLQTQTDEKVGQPSIGMCYGGNSLTDFIIHIV